MVRTMLSGLVLVLSVSIFAAAAPLSDAVVTASATPDLIRFSAAADVTQIRLELTSVAGERLYDSGWRDGNVLDWALSDAGGHRLAGGSYRCTVTVRELGGRVITRRAGIDLNGGSISIDPAAGDGVVVSVPPSQAKVTIVAHTGEAGVIASTSGDLSFRTGDFLSGTDQERLRVTAGGRLGIGVAEPAETLDVAGRVKTDGIVFPDGTVLASAAQAGARPAPPVVLETPRGSAQAARSGGEASILALPAPRPALTANGGRPSLLTTNVNPVVSALSFGGHAARFISVDRNPAAGNAGNLLWILGGAPAQSAADMRGGDMVLSGGVSTGNAYSGNVRFLASTTGAAGTGDNTAYIDRQTIVSKPKAMTLFGGFYHATLINTVPGAGRPAAGTVHFTVVLTNGGSTAAFTGSFRYLATTAVATCRLADDGLSAGIASGNCTLDGSASFGISAAAPQAFSPTSALVYYSIENTSGAGFTLP